jgi:methionyl-tRNA formyltransferase
MSLAPDTLRLAFAGTPAFAVRHLEALLGSRHQVVVVYTQPDRRAGRGRSLAPSPVKQLALDAGIEVMQPGSLRDDSERRVMADLGLDLLVVVAYGLILPQAILDTPRYGCVNVHASLLPRWRGAAPIQRAVEAGDTASGVTIMRMDAGLDTGAMLATATVALDATETGGSLYDRLAEVGPPLLLEVLDALPDYLARAVAQDDAGATYAEKIDKQEARIDWQLDARTLERRVRAFNPFPVCWTELDGERLRLWQASADDASGSPGTILDANAQGILVACGEGSLRLEVVQLPGGKPLSAREILNARVQLFNPGRKLGG